MKMIFITFRKFPKITEYAGEKYIGKDIKKKFDALRGPISWRKSAYRFENCL